MNFHLSFCFYASHKRHSFINSPMIFSSTPWRLWVSETYDVICSNYHDAIRDVTLSALDPVSTSFSTFIFLSTILLKTMALPRGLEEVEAPIKIVATTVFYTSLFIGRHRYYHNNHYHQSSSSIGMQHIYQDHHGHHIIITIIFIRISP